MSRSTARIAALAALVCTAVSTGACNNSPAGEAESGEEAASSDTAASTGTEAEAEAESESSGTPPDMYLGPHDDPGFGCLFYEPSCEPGCKCAVSNIGAPGGDGPSRCVPAGTKTIWENCEILDLQTGEDECGDELRCYFGECRPWCQGSEGTCPLGTTCGFADTPSLNLCVIACIPVGETTDLEERCIWHDGYFELGPVDPMPLQKHAACESASQCAGSFECLDDPVCGGGRCCMPWCRTDEPTTCSSGESCQPLVDPDGSAQALDIVGVCRPTP